MPEPAPAQHRIALRRHLRAEVVPGDAVYLIAETGTTRLSDPRVAVVLDLLDGTRDLAAICRAVADRMPAAETGRVIGTLIRAGFVDRVAAGPAPATAYWDLAGVDGARARERLAATTAHVVPVAGAPTDELVAALRLAGLGATATASSGVPSLTVVSTSDYLASELDDVARSYAASGLRWVPARLDRSSVWFGPFVGPDRGDACWTCVTARLRANRLRSAGSAELVDAAPPVAGSTLTRSLGAHHVALGLAAVVAGLPAPTDELVVHDLASPLAPGTSRHALRRRPQCAECGEPDLVARQVTSPLRIGPSPKAPGTIAVDGAPTTGGERTRTAQQTLDACRHLVDPVTGIVPELRRDPGAPDGMHVYVAGLNVATTAASAAGRRALRHVCGGKGATDLDARTGALCEALERYSGQLHGDEPRRRARFVDLPDAVDPRELMLFGASQYGAGRAPGGGAPDHDRVPEPFDPEAEIDWTPVWSLTEQRHRLLPTALLYYDIDGVTRGGRYVVADSNGNAAGSDRADAIVQGFLELVERDAVAIWWYNRTRQDGLELAAAEDPWLREQHAAHARLGRELVALDLVTDLGIPVVAAVSYRTDANGPADVCFGFGAHFDERTAARRAVAEVDQLIPAALPGNGRYATADDTLITWWRTATPATHPYLLPDPRAPRRQASGPVSAPRPDVADDVAAIVELCRGHGLELLVLDQTRPDIDLAVVKVLVPGLRHFWRRLAPGRLYDVPVALGRLAGPLDPDQLNTQSIFL